MRAIVRSFVEMSATIAVVLVMLAVSVKEIEPSKDAMRYMTSGFFKVLDECKHELNLGDHIVADLYHFWKLEYSLLSRDTGCAIACMSKKLDLLDDSGLMHHGKTREFAMEHGAGEDIASQVISIIHECEKKNDGTEDDCVRILEVAKCFRTGIHELDWNPTAEVVMGEVLTEV